MKPTLVALVFQLFVASMIPAGTDPAPPDPLVGTVAPEWHVSKWINSDAMTLKSLRGKVVLVRWWTGPSCPFCRASSAALAGFHGKYSDDGLVVVGLYHHKSRQPFTRKDVHQMSTSLGFEFPVAVDDGWRTLEDWWLRHAERDFTSVSFLLDRRGIIRHIHAGGQYVAGDGEYELLEARIRELLVEAPSQH